MEKGHDVDQRRASTFQRGSSSFEVTKESALPTIRPPLRDKFNVTQIEALLQETIQEFMKGKTYVPDDAMEWTSTLSSLVNDKVKTHRFPRYKIVSVITIGENIGGGFLSGLKTQWDNSTDAYASYAYITDSLFVIATAFGVYFY